MRRGQLLSFDAVLSLVIVILLLGTITNTSSALKDEVTTMIGWYERANIGDNMLDVLTKNSGDPNNWEANTESVKIPGLRSCTGVGLDYEKVYTLFRGISLNDTFIISSLFNLSEKKDFQFAIFMSQSSLNALINYTLQKQSWIIACHVKELVDMLGNPSDSPALVYCPRGKFRFNHDNGVSYNTYTNYQHVCMNNSVYIGDNFHVNTGEYMGINGDLEIKSDGSLNVSELYLEGDGTIGDNAKVYSSGDINVGGEFDIKSDGHVTAGGSAYFHDELEIGDSGYLTVNGNLYAEGPLKIHKNGNLLVGGSAYINNYMNAENGAYIDIGKDLYVNGDLRSLEYNAEITTGGEIYIKGKATVKGDITSGGGMYVNGEMTIDYGSTVTVNGDLYINGDIDVKGTLTVHGDVYINGDMYIEWGKTVTIDGSLYITGTLTNHGNLNVGNEIHYVSQLPWDESKLNFTVTIPPMVHAPCFLGSSYNLIVFANVTINNTYSPPWFYRNWKELAIINGTLVKGSDIIAASKLRSPWVEYHEREIIVEKLIYNRTYNVTRSSVPMEVYSGVIKHPLSLSDVLVIELPERSGNLTLVSVFLTGDLWGYSVLTLIKENSHIYYSIKMTEVIGNETTETSCNSVNIEDNKIIVPWTCIIPQPTLGTPTRFSVFVHRVEGFETVILRDMGSIGLYMDPLYTVGKIKVWVWDDS